MKAEAPEIEMQPFGNTQLHPSNQASLIPAQSVAYLACLG